MKNKSEILLVGVNAKFIHSNLAIHSIYEYASQYKDKVEIAEYTINNYPDYIMQEIFKKNAPIVAFSCYIWNWEMIKDIIRELKKVAPKTRIWLGGPECSYNAKDVLTDNPEVELIMRGEGEETFLCLCDAVIGGNGQLTDVLGITYRNEAGEICQNGNRPYINMDSLVFCYNNLADYENKIIYYEASRGCPFSCSYCLSSVERGVRFKSLEMVKKELQFFIDHKVKQVKFVDRTFNINEEFTLGIWEYITANDNGVTNFHFEIAGDLLKEKELLLIEKMRPGLIQLEIGVQSTNMETISLIDRNTDFNKLCENVKRIKEMGNTHEHLDLIAGLPGEDFESFGKSYDEVYALKPEQLQLGFLKVLKGSKMEKQAEEYNIKYRKKATYEVLSTRDLSYDDIIRLKLTEEMTEVYYNSGQFATTLEILTKKWGSAFRFYLELGEFYDKKGYLEVSHTRIRRYDILLEFIEAAGLTENEISELKEAMTYDLYARENYKSRPSFAPEEIDLEILKDFFRNEDLRQKYLSAYDGVQPKQLSKLVHLERFSYGTVLFDYKTKDVMNNCALITVLDETL